MGGVMPVPAVCGGAIETLITSIVKQYSKEDNIQLTIFSVYHKEAVEASKNIQRYDLSGHTQILSGIWQSMPSF